MSRSLDQIVKAISQGDESQRVYDDIAQVLTEETQERTGRLAIELLGESHEIFNGANFLVDGNSIAIPRTKLIQAFVIARSILLFYLKEPSNDKHDDVRKATAVLLLTDPENLTAVNTRKRLLQDKAFFKEGLEQIARDELRFTDSLLTSPLHRHNKSPTLWSHRRWLVESFWHLKCLGSIQDVFINVILPSAEKHPKNYYAWSHIRWLISHSTKHGHNGQAETFERISDHDPFQLLAIIKRWCLRNPSDTSGWSFLFFCLRSIQDTEICIASSSSICQEVLDHSVSFRWTHESVWVFLRTLLATRKISKEQSLAFFRAIQTLTQAQEPDTLGVRILSGARDWCVKYEREDGL